MRPVLLSTLLAMLLMQPGAVWAAAPSGPLSRPTFPAVGDDEEEAEELDEASDEDEDEDEDTTAEKPKPEAEARPADTPPASDAPEPKTDKPAPAPPTKPAPKANPKSVMTYGAISHSGFSPALDGRIKIAVQKRERHFRFCHERALKTAPTTMGKVTLQVTVGLRGNTTAVKTPENATGNADLARCLERRARRLRFPPPSSEGQVTIPLVFTVE